MRKLILFDIDGTLIDPGGAGTRSANRAFYDLFSIENAFNGITMAGKTDRRIIKEGLAACGLGADDGLLNSIFAVYLRHLDREIRNRKSHVKPGVRELLDILIERDDCRTALLTGNIEPGARIKLGAFDLNKYFSFGAFGDDHEDRNSLLPTAVGKFRELTGNSIAYADCIIIGDTPKDVECSKLYGAVSVGVTTGPYNHDSLAAAGADYVLRDLTTAADILIREICVV